MRNSFYGIQAQLTRLRAEMLALIGLKMTGVVTQVNPVRVRVDGHHDPLPESPGVLASSIAPGDRVALLKFGNKYWLLSAFAPADEGAWHDFEITNTTHFASSTTVPLQFRRQAGRVVLEGEMSCTTAGHISGTTSRVIGVIPASFRPVRDTGRVVQANGSNRVYLRIRANGEVALSRFGPASNPAGAWIEVSAEWAYK